MDIQKPLSPVDPKKLVLLDRDGVINIDSSDYIKSPEEWIAIPGSLEAIASFTSAGISVCVITNQSGIGRGLFNESTLHAMHAKMDLQLAALGGSIAKIYFCPHTPDPKCDCRKPNTRMLDNLESDFSLSVKGVPFIGDTAKDLELASKKSCLPILVKTGKGKHFFDTSFIDSPFSKSSLVFENLYDASQHLLSKHF